MLKTVRNVTTWQRTYPSPPCQVHSSMHTNRCQCSHTAAGAAARRLCQRVRRRLHRQCPQHPPRYSSRNTERRVRTRKTFTLAFVRRINTDNAWNKRRAMRLRVMLGDGSLLSNRNVTMRSQRRRRHSTTFTHCTEYAGNHAAEWYKCTRTRYYFATSCIISLLSRLALV